LQWEQQGTVLEPGAVGAWDSLLVGRPSVIFENGLFRMWYDGRKDLPLGAPAANVPTSPSSTRAVGYAESKDGLIWKRSHEKPVFGNDAGGVHVSKLGDAYLMVYESRDGTQAAKSFDGIRWTPLGQMLSRSGGSEDEHGHVTPMLLQRHHAESWLYFGAARAATWDENLIARAAVSVSLGPQPSGP
jgi:hypothetical protein